LDVDAYLHAGKGIAESSDIQRIHGAVDAMPRQRNSCSYVPVNFGKSRSWKTGKNQRKSHTGNRMFSFFLTVFLLMVPLVSVSIISFPLHSNQMNVSISFDPETVHTNDTMIITVTLFSWYDVESIYVDMGDLDCKPLFLIKTESHVQKWQTTWTVPSCNPGEYLATITLVNETNESNTFGKIWIVIPETNSQETFNVSTNETVELLNQTNNQTENIPNETGRLIHSGNKTQSEFFVSNCSISQNQNISANENSNQSLPQLPEACEITETPLDTFHKQVIISSDIHYTNITAFSTIDNRPNSSIHLYHIVNDSKTEVQFIGIDADHNNLIDRIEWTVPHLSEETYEIIIEVTNAEHLDTDRIFLSTLSTEVMAADGFWSEPIANGEYVRVSFEDALTNNNDITIIVRSRGQSRIEVFKKDSMVLLATFENITQEHYYKVYLTNLKDIETTFDLKTIGDPVEYDYIVDPTTGWVSPTGFADPDNQWTSENYVYDDNTGTYATHAGGAGWRGFVELTLSSPIYCDRVRVFSDFGYGVVDRVDIDIYNSSSWIDKYNDTISDAAWSEISFSAETNVTKARFRYHYLAGGWQFWLYEFDFWQGQPLTLPNGTTFNATSIDETTAILNGNVSDDGGESCQYRFQYGVNTSYGTNTSWGGSEVKDSQFTTMIHNLTLGQTYQFRVQIRNSVGTVNGSNNNFTTAIPSLGWVTPTSHDDPNAQWENENDVYDDAIESYTRSYHNANDVDGVWSFFIYVNHSVLLCDKVRFYAKGPTGSPPYIDQVDLDVKKGETWVDIYQGTFADRQWVEKSFTQGSVTSARLRFRVSSNNGGLYYELNEFDFNKSRPVPMIVNESPINKSWGISLRPQLNITVNNPDGANMTITWSSNSSGSWQVFGTNTSVSNGTYHQRNNNFSTNNTKYWWKVTVTDSIDTNSSVFYFSTQDHLQPTSSVDAITSYWKKTSPITITATAVDTGWSGLKNVTLYYRFSNNNASWDGWKSVGVDTASPWSWSFSFTNGSGYYQFYSLAKDNATNTEASPGGADTKCGYDATIPSSAVDTISSYWKTTALAITATANDATSGVKNITLYYRYSANNVTWGGWVSAGLDSAVPWSWSFTFSNGSGYYQFYSIAKDNATNAESVPSSPDTRCGYDNQVSSSSVTAISGYWKTTLPLTITASAGETGPSGLKNVTLYYRYRAVNASGWGGNGSYGVDADPWVACSWSFTFPNGTGHYQFYSISKDNASNTEPAPGSPDTECGFDGIAPVSSIDGTPSYWKTASPIPITVTATDATSGVKNVTVYYRFSTNNATWGGWVNEGVDMVLPWSWSFSFSNGSGYYQFYSIARDNATNTESTPGSPDLRCGYDNQTATSVVTPLPLYWKIASPQTITCTASDTGCSGLKNITLWYRYRATNASVWDTWVSSGLIDSNPWTSISWSFSFSNGTGQYQFYSIACDNASNVEGIPGGSDASCGYDNQIPSSFINTIAGYWKSPSSIQIISTANDSGPSGLKNVTLYYRFRATNTTDWGGNVSAGVDVNPWIACSWSFTFPNGTGHYQFYSVARDNATITETVPGSMDAWCGYDDQRPSSSVNILLGYWKRTSPIPLNATANDIGSGVKNVTLFYCFSINNVSWDGWMNAGVDTTPPWSWSFTCPNGTGYYQFFSIARDNLTNTEIFPGSADTRCGYDSNAPNSSVNTMTSYWKNTATIITATATDMSSGVNNVTLYYRFSDNNATWGGWVNAGTNLHLPWSWNMTFVNGSGYYQFYSIASDNATNIESIPGNADVWCGYDNHRPASSVNAIEGYWKTSTPILIIASVSDTGLSGLKNTSLYYRYRAINSSGWGSFICFSIDTNPWTNCSWNFPFPNGAGHYQFYSIAVDNATNMETIPGGNGDTECGLNTGVPISVVTQIEPYWTSVNHLLIEASAEDTGLSGLRNVTLYYYNSTDNLTWTGPWRYGVDSDPWISCSWNFLFPNQTGYYRFYSCASDNSSHVEAAPLINDTEGGYDILSPSCSISYNTSADCFKASDSLRIYVNFTEKYSGIDEARVFIAITTNGDGDLTNTSMTMIDNTHWYYTWMIPSGSDDDGLVVVRIYARDMVSNNLTPNPTSDASKQIDNTPPLISNITAENIATTSVQICWRTNENTTNRIEYGTSLAFGLWSYSSVSTRFHQVDLYSLSAGTIYYYHIVSYDSAGNQATSLNESFTTLSQPSKKKTTVEVIPNAPPSNPVIEGPTTGRRALSYTFTASSVDTDSNSISYTFDWGDGSRESSGFIPNRMKCSRNHSWALAGKYTIIVTANDTTSGSLSKMIIWIDAIIVGDEGYLVDNNSDGLFDIFYNEKTGVKTETQQSAGVYLIDVNGDQQWDYQFNASSGSLSYILHQQQGGENTSSPLILMSSIVLVVLFIVLIIMLFRRWSSKK